MPRFETEEEREEFLKHRMGKHYLNEKELKRIKDAFNEFDVNKTGEIELQELIEAIKDADLNIEDEDIQKFFENVNKTGKLYIDFDQFIELITENFLCELDDMNSLNKIFCTFLGNEDSSVITFDLLKEKCGDRYTDEEIQEMINYADKDGKGGVNFEEFCNIMKRA